MLVVGTGELQEILPLYPDSTRHFVFVSCKGQNLISSFFFPQKFVSHIAVLIIISVVALGCRNCTIKTSFSLVFM